MRTLEPAAAGCAQSKLGDESVRTSERMTLQPVLLSGGSGTRLWPLSREAHPKQFLPLAGDDTMLQATWRRVAALAEATSSAGPAVGPIVVAGEEHRFLVAEQLRAIGAPRPAILLEPVGRNTAPAIAAAALQAMAGGGDPLLLVLPSDHIVRGAQRDAGGGARRAGDVRHRAGCAGDGLRVHTRRGRRRRAQGAAFRREARCRDRTALPQ
jgi:hypothetical protein